MSTPLAGTFADSSPQTSRSRRWLGVTIQLVAALIAAYAIFRMGALWSSRGFAQAQPVPGPNPFLANFPRYSIAALWPLPGAILLFFSASAFRQRTPRWWILLLVAALWFAAYLLVRSPQMYYYWLVPRPS